MRKPFAVTLAIFFAIVLIAAQPLVAQRNEVRKVEDAIDVFRQITEVPDKEVPDTMMTDAYALAIVPEVQKAAFVIGGQYGKGVLLVKNPGGSWSAPVFITLKGGSVGWQVGIQSIDLLLFFRTKRSLDGVLDGSFTLGVDASIAAGGLGRQAGASTDAEMKSEIYSYARTRGLFAGVQIAGATIDVDDDANSAYYGRGDVNPQDIIQGKLVAVPPSAAELRRMLDGYVKSLSK